MKKTFYLIVAMAFALSATAQQKGGGISPKMLQEIVNAQPKGAASKALANAIATNNIDDLARTRALRTRNHQAVAGCSAD